jgi:hypothetical protein
MQEASGVNLEMVDFDIAFAILYNRNCQGGEDSLVLRRGSFDREAERRNL